MAHYTGYHIGLELSEAHQQSMREDRERDRLAQQAVTARAARPAWWTLAYQHLARRSTPAGSRPSGWTSIGAHRAAADARAAD